MAGGRSQKHGTSGQRRWECGERLRMSSLGHTKADFGGFYLFIHSFIVINIFSPIVLLRIYPLY